MPEGGWGIVMDKELTAGEFSFRTREHAFQRFRNEEFDLLIVGGGITGAAVARDASSRGLSVALVERRDFAFGTSSRSSKLVHGGLRYLQNFELSLVFEALSERAHLLKSAPRRVRPLPFFMPIYRNDPHSAGLLSIGLWLYDLLALFRTPGFHKRLSKKALLEAIPFLKKEGLLAGFRYFDASMWDDVLAVETLRSASQMGAAVANYIEAVKPVWTSDQISGFIVRDCEPVGKDLGQSWTLRAKRTLICAGPWTDQVGRTLSPEWHRWLRPSKGVHLVFDLKRIPIPGAMVMNHPEDGRVAFVVPRPDFGTGVVLVGTTDGATDEDPDKCEITASDVNYLLNLLAKYFPDLQLTEKDILSAYIGVRPLVKGSRDDEKADKSLQKVSREHQIENGPGGTVIVAGGKYTTHRTMAKEIVDYTLRMWREDDHKKKKKTLPEGIGPSRTNAPVSCDATPEETERLLELAKSKGKQIPNALLERYGAASIEIVQSGGDEEADGLPGFPSLEAQLKYTIRHEMVMHLEDFYLRRVPLYLTRKDHGASWAPQLAKVWGEVRGVDAAEVEAELERLNRELSLRSAWESERNL